MATYPSTLPISRSTRLTPDAGIDIDRASNGAARARRLYTADRGRIMLEHNALGVSDRAALDAFYTTNKDLAFDLVLDGVTYSCLFAAAPVPRYLGANLADMTVEVVIA